MPRVDTTPLSPFRIITDGIRGTVEVDGRDVTSQVAGLAFDAGNGEVARLTLQLAPHAGVIEGLAVVEQQHGATTGDAVRQLDPELVRQLVAERNLTFTDDPYNATLEVVADLLDQAAGVPGG